MKKLELSQKTFESKLKKYPTNKVAEFFAKIDRECYAHSLESEDKLMQHEFGTLYRSQRLYVKTWLLSDIIFYSTNYNDFRKGNLLDSKTGWDIYGYYHNFKRI